MVPALAEKPSYGATMPHSSDIHSPIKKYIVTIMGNRGSYQVPLALHETRSLAKFITDFYTPDWLSQHTQDHYPALTKRHHSAIPSRVVQPSLTISAYQAIIKFTNASSNAHWSRIDRWLSMRTAKFAQLHPECGLLCYQNYAYNAFTTTTNSPKILFQYHPHPLFFKKLYEKDVQRFTEVQWSFDNERDTQYQQFSENSALNEFQYADAVICTSNVIKRSLKEAGCACPIHIVPYGILRNFETTGLIRKKRGDVCRFLFVGQGVQRKGLHHLLRAWRTAALKKSTLEIIASPFDPGIATLLPLPGVNVRQKVSDEELAVFFGEAHVFVMPSLVEGFGRVYLEALSAGCFCLGTSNTGLPDLELDANSVDYVDVGHVDLLAKKLQQLEQRWIQGGLDPNAIAAVAKRLCPEGYRARLRAVLGQIERATLELQW